MKVRVWCRLLRKWRDLRAARQTCGRLPELSSGTTELTRAPVTGSRSPWRRRPCSLARARRTWEARAGRRPERQVRHAHCQSASSLRLTKCDAETSLALLGLTRFRRPRRICHRTTPVGQRSRLKTSHDRPSSSRTASRLSARPNLLQSSRTGPSSSEAFLSSNSITSRRLFAPPA